MRFPFLRRLRLSASSLRVQLLLWVTLPVAISVLAISLADVHSHEQAMRRLMQERAGGLAQASASLITARLERNQDRLRQLAGAIAANTVGPGSAALAQGSPSVAGLALFAGNGTPVPSDAGLDWPHSPQVQALVQRVSDSRQAGAVTLEDQGAGGLLVQAVPVDGASGEVLAGATPLTALDLAGLIADLSLSDTAELHLEAPDGTTLLQLAARHGAEGPWPPAKTVTASGHVAPVGWHVVLRESWADLVPPVLRFENAVFVVLLAAVGISLLSAYFGLRRIAWPLQRLNAAASQVGWGNFAAIRQPVEGVREIEELRLALARMADQIRQYQQELRSYIGAVTLGQEEERKRLARELHDETVQALIALNQRVELVERRLPQDPEEAARRLQELRPLLAETIAGLRRQIHDLRPLYLEDLGFVPALEMLVRQVSQRHGLVGDCEMTGQPVRRLPPAVEISAYRIVQEALHNVVRHAQATWVHVELTFDQAGVSLRVEDDGCGFAAPAHAYQLAQAGHYGLLGMQERAQLYGGHLHIESQIGRGTVIEARLNLPVSEGLTDSGQPSP